MRRERVTEAQVAAARERLLQATVSEVEAASQTADPWLIIEHAREELAGLPAVEDPVAAATIKRYVDALSNRDYMMLRYWKQGMKHAEIAEVLQTDVETVRASLVNIYADLRAELR